MIHNYRQFEAIDLFGRVWNVEFRWQQTGISIRHADTVDVKWRLACPDQALEKVIALPHALLLKASKKFDHPLTDPWCMKLAACHLRKMIETWQDMDKNLITLMADELEEAAQCVGGWEKSRREEALMA